MMVTQPQNKMKIQNAAWNEIAALMGTDATESEALSMIELLTAKGVEDTNELDDSEFFALVAVAGAQSRKHAAAAMGRVKSEAKAAAAKANGKKGGRPRKK